MALRGANQITELYPKEFEQGCCQKTWKKDEYNTLTPDQIICIPSERNADGSIDIIMSNRVGKVFCRTEAADRIAWEDTSHSMPGDWLFPWEELPRNCSRIDVLEWYIDITNEMNLSLQNIALFPMAVDHRLLTVHTRISNVWYSYIDRHNLLNSDCLCWFCPSSVFYANLYGTPRATNHLWPWKTAPLEEIVRHLLQKELK
jgi:hypothetical protein